MWGSYWIGGLIAEMKLFLALAGLLATLPMPQAYDNATSGNSSKRRVRCARGGSQGLLFLSTGLLGSEA